MRPIRKLAMNKYINLIEVIPLIWKKYIYYVYKYILYIYILWNIYIPEDWNNFNQIDVFIHSKLSNYGRSVAQTQNLKSWSVLRNVTSPPNSTPLMFPFQLLSSLVHPTGFSFCFFPDFHAIFILFSSNNNNNNGFQP